MKTDEAPKSRSEITFSRLLYLVLAGWKIIGVSVFVCFLLSLWVLSGTPATYTARMTVAPMPSEVSPGVNTSTLSSALSLLGQGGGLGGNQTFSHYILLYSSLSMADRLEQKYHLLQQINSGSWDPVHQQWIRPQSWRPFFLGWLFSLSHLPMWTPPDDTTLAAYLKSKVVMENSLKSDVVTISYTDRNPAFARQLLMELHQEANDLLRQQAEERASQKVAYLEGQLRKIDVADYRETLLLLLSEQQKTLLLTQPGLPYAAEVIDPPSTSPIPTSPRPVLTIAVSIMVGGILGVLIVLFFGPYLSLDAMSKLWKSKRKRSRVQ
jgi:uncharacterized protein involved in exopolysaccharide biosynthesis